MVHQARQDLRDRRDFLAVVLREVLLVLQARPAHQDLRAFRVAV